MITQEELKIIESLFIKYKKDHYRLMYFLLEKSGLSVEKIYTVINLLLRKYLNSSHLAKDKEHYKKISKEIKQFIYK